MRKISIVVFALVLALPLAAQTPEEVLRGVLNLNDDQIAALQQLLQARASAIQPIEVQIRQTEAQLAQLLYSESPDPCVVGALAQTIHSLRRQVGGHFEQFQQSFAAILNDDQKQRLEFIFGVERALHAAGALHQLGL